MDVSSLHDVRPSKCGQKKLQTFSVRPHDKDKTLERRPVFPDRIALQGSICTELKGSTASVKTPIGDGSMTRADTYSAGAVPITE
jgi:hypothetical protein